MDRLVPLDFEMFYKIQFSANIRGHHVYKRHWTPAIGELLTVKKDDPEEAKMHDKHAVGVYRGETLSIHIPMELSNLIDYLLKTLENARVEARAEGKRKRELGLVVPAKFTTYTSNKKVAEVLLSELNNKKEKY